MKNSIAEGSSYKKTKTIQMTCSVKYQHLLFGFFYTRFIFKKSVKKMKNGFIRCKKEMSVTFSVKFFCKHLNVSASVHSVTLDKKSENMK